ncbi:MAG TPA: Gfo/Idh/MocA family oxidoreductase [Bacteroidales bacterium]|nr:Gfo/Idh/MocA family oxidoreductase [Bacteroidales bacterium]
MKTGISRRNFLGTTAAAASLTTLSFPTLLSGCSSEKGKTKKTVEVMTFLDQAPDGPELKAGLIGCGGRGTGAAINFLNAGPNLKVTALGDVLQDRIDSCREELKKQKNNEVADEMCFVGFDAFQKVIDSGVDIVILATPPHFRPDQFEAAVNAKKHVFMEKPVCVDPVGARSVIATARKAAGMGLSVVTGTQRRHQRDYVATYKNVAEGMIGEIVSANCWWNGGKLWHRDKDAKWNEMEYMIRDWVNWCWLSGDHIVEQHVHNLDVIHWFTGKFPVKAVGFGSRLRRVTGDQYDNFSVDFTFDNGIHMHSMCRQINGCANNVSERIQGATGSTNCQNSILDLSGTELWKYEYPMGENGQPGTEVKISPYDQEHIDLVTAIRTGKPINEAENTAMSTLVAIMGRVSAYTGKEVTMDEMMNSDLKLGPKVYAFGPVDVSKTVPIAGEAYVPGSQS